MSPADRLRQSVRAAVPHLLALEDPEGRPAPQAWAPAETIGHLIDSAVNNHGRFVRAAGGGGLTFERYDQEGWVEAGRYRDADWADLVSLWRLYNEQLARVIDGIPDSILNQPHRDHSISKLYGPADLAPDAPATLRMLVEDYVDHLRHHLAIIDPVLIHV